MPSLVRGLLSSTRHVTSCLAPPTLITVFGWSLLCAAISSMLGTCQASFITGDCPHPWPTSPSWVQGFSCSVCQPDTHTANLSYLPLRNYLSGADLPYLCTAQLSGDGACLVSPGRTGPASLSLPLPQHQTICQSQIQLRWMVFNN